MGTRDISVSICGAIVGIIVGAGLLSLADGTALGAAVIRVNGARLVPKAQQYKARYIKATPVLEDITRYPTIKEESSSSSSSSASTDSVVACALAKSIVEDVKVGQDEVLNKTELKVTLKSEMQKVLTEVTEKYCK